MRPASWTRSAPGSRVSRTTLRSCRGPCARRPAPIGAGEIGPGQGGCRRAGAGIGAVGDLQSRAWFGMGAGRMAPWWTSHDLLLTPTLGAPPPELGWFTAEGPQGEGRRIVSFIPYTAQFNMTGQPAVAVPLHWTPDGLPGAVQLVAPDGRQDRP